ncbi:hypothetical protein DV736_g5597, partial [Chaetothyriales sp. CBS 134916]
MTTPPSLQHIATLPSPSGPTVRAWQSVPHPSASSHQPILATASNDKSVHIWSLRDWTLLSSIRDGHKRSVRCVGWKNYADTNTTQPITDKRRKLVLASGSFDSNVGIWEYNSASSVSNPALSLPMPSGTNNNNDGDNEPQEQDMTLNGNNDDDEWIFTTLLTGPDSEIKSLAFAPAHYSATLLATSSRDKSVWIWEEVDADDGEWETVAVLQEHSGDVKCVAWCEGACLPSQRQIWRQQHPRQQQLNGEHTAMVDEDMEEAGQENRMIGSREVLASGSYDDTIRLYRDVESEGDWVCIAVLEGHTGTVWSVKFEPYINTAVLPPTISTRGELALEWEPRLISCSDDLSVRVWKRELSNEEQSVYEKWTQEAVLPAAHVRSVYSVDWSRRSGLVVSCGGDGVIALYKEVSTQPAAGESDSDADVDMNGTATTTTTAATATTWKIVALVEAAHDEYEINHYWRQWRC